MIPFVKYHGAGNDFILIDDLEGHFPSDDSELIENLCDRRKGVGADGLILLQHSHRADFRMRIFNSDGKEASMCGNGLRCLIAFIRDEELLPATAYKIEVNHHVFTCCLDGDQIATAMGKPQTLHWKKQCEGAEAYVVDTGVPHAIIFTPSIEAVDVASLGKKIRYHSQFNPYGVNATFVHVRSPSQITVRTYERGVEGETLACGTGAAAAAFVAAEVHGLSFPLEVIPASQEKMIVSQTAEGELVLSGPATRVFSGIIEPGAHAGAGSGAMEEKG